jgi:molybdenum cofactor cytidylyltransferase
VIFGSVPVAEAIGAVLVHTTRAGARVLKKGRRLDRDDVAALAAAGVAAVVAARLEPGELDEDAAAAAIAAGLAPDGPGGPAAAGLRIDPARTGRANVFAAVDGLVVVDGAAVDAVNAIDEAVTLATAPRHAAVRAGEMIATVKVIPFAAAATTVESATSAARGAIAVRPWRGARAGLVLTRFADTAPRLLERAAAAQRARLGRCGGAIAREVTVAHEVAEVATALAAMAAEGLDPILALGASAIMDRRDVIPAALTAAGGAIVRLGMPVDPGNLLLLGRLGAAAMLGVPGCARSEKRSGFDAVLERLCAGVPVDAAAIAAMGVGGLLEEVDARHAPRAGAAAVDGDGDGEADDASPPPPRVAAVVLAAGRSARMGANKLLAELAGEPIVRHAVRAALASRARPVIVVTGNQAAGVEAALAGLPVRCVHNPDFADGMATSLQVGLAAVPAEIDGALVCLGDMPRVTAGHLDAIAAAFVPEPAPGDGGAIVVPTCARKRGNPVLWGRRFFAEIAALRGDVGARALLERYADQVVMVAIEDPGILIDVDTPEALAAVRGQ